MAANNGGDGPEPTGWELMRGLEDVRRSVEKVGERVVSTDVYNANNTATAERFERIEARVRDREIAAAAAVTAAEDARKENDKIRRQNQFVVSMAVVSMVLSIVGGLILRSLPL